MSEQELKPSKKKKNPKFVSNVLAWSLIAAEIVIVAVIVLVLVLTIH